jgi:hypothetical protein
MSEPANTGKAAPEADTGPYRRAPRRSGPGAAETVAIVLSALWLFASAAFFVFVDATGAGFDPLRFVVTLLAIFLPVALIWVSSEAAKNARTVREETARLEAAIDALRQAYLSSQGGKTTGAEVEQKLREIADSTKKTETALATFTSIRNAAPPVAPLPPLPGDGGDQPSLALGAPPDATGAPLDVEDFISALQFPATAEDKEGFRALRRALQDRRAAQLIQAAQDVLTLLSQEGIYMDDLRPDRARPELWRRFAKGERGRPIAALGGIRDRSSLALSAARMKTDMVFRDAVHHFLRKFDHTFADMEEGLTDQEIAALTDTRTARAFMLLGRVTGTFD